MGKTNNVIMHIDVFHKSVIMQKNIPETGMSLQRVELLLESDQPAGS